MYETKSSTQVLQELNSSQNGLSQSEAAERIVTYGENILQEEKPPTKLQMFLAQLNDPMIFILLAAAAISIFLGEYSDAVIIGCVVLLNAIVGIIQEGKAQRALEALKKISSPFAMVRREGVASEIPAAKLVPGDIVLLEAGRIIPADLRLLSSINLKIEESALTGESVPVEKQATFIATADTTLGDRLNMAYMSTSVSYGRGEGIVIATAEKTEIGKIATMIMNGKEPPTPLQKRLAQLSKLLGILAIIICAAMFAIALIQGRDIAEMLITAISLAVAAVPEGLPAVVTIVLAFGVQRMVKINSIVRRLPAVETLGAVSTVCSDKTGTLTQNKMTVLQVYVDQQLQSVEQLNYPQNKLFIDGFALCTDASVENAARLGDPTELALLDMAARWSISRPGLEQQAPRINEQAFDSGRKLMTTVHQQQGNTIAFTKGAVDRLLPLCTQISINGQLRPFDAQDQQQIMIAASTMAADALRVLALAIKYDDDRADESNLAFIGLVGMIDPPRPEAKQAVLD
ncbi:MAG: HAD-IC family P-type ATPase, partial [Clostridiales bacterium]